MYALIHNSQLILGPIRYNYRLINSELEDLEIEQRVGPRDFENVPLKIDDVTYLIPVTQIIPSHDSRFQSLGNFTWEVIIEDNNPIRVEMTYQINDKSLEAIKEEYKAQVAPIRREKETTTIEITLNENIIKVSTSRETRLNYVSKLVASSGPYNFKFGNNSWLEITKEELEYIISQIDSKVQEAFDWEFSKVQEIDACTTGEEVYDVVLREQETPDAIPTNN